MTIDERLHEVEVELYGVPPAEFVERRDQATRDAKQAGDRELADAISGLRKPTTAAWALNSFVRAHATTIDDLLELAGRLRAAVGRGAGDDIRELMRERSRAIAEVVAAVRRHAEEHGRPLSASVDNQVERTLRAAMASHDDAARVRSGSLATALEASGLDSLGSGGASRGRAPSPADPTSGHDDDRARRDAERRVSTAAAEVDRIERELDAASSRRAGLETERTTLRQRLGEVEQRLAEEQAAETDAGARLEAARSELQAARADVRRHG